MLRFTRIHEAPLDAAQAASAVRLRLSYDERVKAGKATINGVDVSNKAKNTEWAKQIVAFRTEKTIEAINKAIANKGTLPAPPRQRPGGE